jgi:hypothetical protein
MMTVDSKNNRERIQRSKRSVSFDEKEESDYSNGFRRLNVERSRGRLFRE